MQYNTCAECGAHLDPGEKCDCQKEHGCIGGDGAARGTERACPIQQGDFTVDFYGARHTHGAARTEAIFD